MFEKPSAGISFGKIVCLNLNVLKKTSLKGHSEDVELISVSGESSTEYFKGKIKNETTIVKKIEHGNIRNLDARFILEGEDNTGKSCKIFLEINGISREISDKFEARITTDSDELQWVTNAELACEIENNGDEIIIKISAKKGIKQAVNPYLPHYEYIPDGEPYVFNDRVYIYGSHDYYNGAVFCMGDYICYSAPVNDLGNWRYEGVIYRKEEDPANKDGSMCLYAPDVTVGPDGRYYLYYVLDHLSVISVAVCDTPSGEYKFYGYVHYEDGTKLGDREGDEPQFDPAVLTEGDKTYLYSGFCGPGDKSRTGAMASVLGPDMLTIIEEPRLVAPGCMCDDIRDFVDHTFFEASSIRKRGDKYYFVYSSCVMHELCYAMSDSPLGPFSYGGVIVSNTDLHIDTYKPADMPGAAGANNHGSIVQIGEDWYIFYHRHTNDTWYSRQGCAEKISFDADGNIPQVEITSCGLNGGPLEARGIYPAYIACNLMAPGMDKYVSDGMAPKVMQDGGDGDRELSFVANVTDGSAVGFKYFEYSGVKKMKISARGYGDGEIEIRTSWDGEVLGKVKLKYTDIWESYETDVNIPDGVAALYLTYRGDGNVGIRDFEFI
ncbi:MAG: family 43 glycosylhydrolase [Eubacterium sp.]|nr:family 43 glycosylhydrolase [Eubacterium sp.]